jgi:hypothetical protein
MRPWIVLTDFNKKGTNPFWGRGGEWEYIAFTYFIGINPIRIR